MDQRQDTRPVASECAHYWNTKFRTVLEDDPDIDGVGVLLAFLIPAWLILCLLTIGYFVVENAIPEHKLNQVDSAVLCTLSPRSASKRTRQRAFSLTAKPLRSFALTLSDQQLVTGLAILIVGFAKKQDITQHHFDIISNLGWLSFSVFGCTTTILWEHFNSNIVARLWRTVWAVVVAGLLAVTIVTENTAPWDHHLPRPVHCAWAELSMDFDIRLGALLFFVGNWVVLVWTLLHILSDLWPGEVGALLSRTAYIIEKPAHKLTEWSSKLGSSNTPTSSKTSFYMIKVLALILKIVAQCWILSVELTRSQVVDLMRASYLLLKGTLGVLFRRYFYTFTYWRGSRLKADNDWSFGQVVPLILLALPFLNFWELCYDARRERREDAARPTSSSAQRPADLTSSQDNGAATTALRPPEPALHRPSSFSAPSRSDTESLRAQDTTNSVEDAPFSSGSSAAISCAETPSPRRNTRSIRSSVETGPLPGVHASFPKRPSKQMQWAMVANMLSSRASRVTLVVVVIILWCVVIVIAVLTEMWLRDFMKDTIGPRMENLAFNGYRLY